jgi:hypothetical protein
VTGQLLTRLSGTTDGRHPGAASGVLGYRMIDSTRDYTAVYPEEVIRHYQTFIHERRATRPFAEYRDPTDAEWAEFERHFTLRKVAYGNCDRPYGSPCAHEHALLTELTPIFQQFMAGFRSLPLTCPRDRIG